MSQETVTIGDATLIRGDCLSVMPTLGLVDARRRIEAVQWAYKDSLMFGSEQAEAKAAA